MTLSWRRIEQTLIKLPNFAGDDSAVKLRSYSQGKMALSKSNNITPLKISQKSTCVPSLPKIKPVQLSTNTHAPNPQLATILLQDLEQNLISWQRELKIIQKQIEDIYLEGAIINGWLESYESSKIKVSKSAPDVHRQKEINAQADHVNLSTSHQYRLCRLDEQGRLWYRWCHPQQLGYLSMAIARYHRFRKLKTRQQDLCHHLQQFTETLINFHGNFN